MKSIGVDIIEIDRVEKIILEFGDRFLNKVYTVAEINYCKSKAKPSQHFAARFAAKEAVAKALGTGFGKDLMLKDIEVRNDLNGKPIVFYKGNKNEKVLISISHCDHYVVAFAVLKE
ncbi:MAG: holo-ACP synthase [Ignavibacteria bacterium]